MKYPQEKETELLQDIIIEEINNKLHISKHKFIKGPMSYKFESKNRIFIIYFNDADLVVSSYIIHQGNYGRTPSDSDIYHETIPFSDPRCEPDYISQKIVKYL